MKIMDYLKQQGWKWQYTDLDDKGTILLVWSIMPLPGEAIDCEKKIGDSWYNIKYADTTGRTMIIKRYIKKYNSSISFIDFSTNIATHAAEPMTTILKEDILFNGVIKAVDELTTILKTLNIL